jgi:16S rRNA (guanine966-N2)-methyltransferase
VTRIIAGKAGSLNLEVPQGPTRPTSERVREAMFSAIDHLIDLPGAHVLDLYAGSGALGLEAASRGATRVVFVDSSKKAARVLATNISRIRQSLGDGHTFQVMTSPAMTFCQNLHASESFDLVLLDPPYDHSAEDITDCLLALRPALADGSLVIVERAKKSVAPQWPGFLEVIRHKTYGDTAVFFLAHRR